MANLVSLERVSLVFGTAHVLDDVSIGVLTGDRIGILSQDDALDPEWTVREAVLGDRPEHVWAGDPRIRDVLTGLLGGIGAESVGGFDALVGPLSGGERRRLALARLL